MSENVVKCIDYNTIQKEFERAFLEALNNMKPEDVDKLSFFCRDLE
ncbi:hypothetical protein [Neptuniibacter sp. QD37_11]